jgi:protein Mpv17
MGNTSLIFNPLKQLWGAYERQLERRPVLTQMTTSAVLWCSGDVIAQRLEHWEKQVQHKKNLADAAAAGSTKAVKGAHPRSAEVSSTGASSDDSPQLVIDWRRAIMTGMFGSTFVGPVGHFWYINLDKWCARVFPGGGAKFIAAKVSPAPVAPALHVGRLYVQQWLKQQAHCKAATNRRQCAQQLQAARLNVCSSSSTFA